MLHPYIGTTAGNSFCQMSILVGFWRQSHWSSCESGSLIPTSPTSPAPPAFPASPALFFIHSENNKKHLFPPPASPHDLGSPCCFRSTERVGFEPTLGFPKPHFECGAFNRSATSPIRCELDLFYRIECCICKSLPKKTCAVSIGETGFLLQFFLLQCGSLIFLRLQSRFKSPCRRPLQRPVASRPKYLSFALT